MRRLLLALVVLFAAPMALAQTGSAPSAALVAMRDRFETEFLALERDFPGNADELRAAAIPIARRVYGADWSVVRAETTRSLAALARFDLAPHQRQPFETPMATNPDLAAGLALLMDPGALAGMRFWDANFVGAYMAASAVDINLLDMPSSRLATVMGFAPTRVYRGRMDGDDVLVSRYLRSIVVTPYSITREGMIFPDVERVRVYAQLLPAG